jgi:hypothetical protein
MVQLAASSGDPPKHLHRLLPQRPGDEDELRDFDPTLAGLVVGDEALGASQARRELGLREVGPFPRLDEERAQLCAQAIFLLSGLSGGNIQKTDISVIGIISEGDSHQDRSDLRGGG